MTESTPPTLVGQQQLGHRYRGLLRLAIMVLLAATLFSLLYVLIDNMSFWENFTTGIIVGFIGISTSAAAALAGETATVEVGDKGAFVVRMTTAASQLGYSSATQTENLYIYGPSSWWKVEVFAWPISVHLHDEQATIVGPKKYVERLLKEIG